MGRWPFAIGPKEFSLNNMAGEFKHDRFSSEADAPLVDPFGRAITCLRVLVTDRCDFECVYCMSEDMNFLPKRNI